MLKSFIVVFLFSLLAFFDGVAGQETFDDHFRGKGRQSQTSAASQAVAQTSVASTAATGGAKAANNGANTNGNDNNGAAALNPQLIQSASESNGNPSNGQSASETDGHNFINYCGGKTLTNGQQITSGPSCNGIVMGDIPSKDDMISAIILEPQMNVPIAANQDFNVRVQTNNLVAGVFTNPDNTYYAAPQQLQGGKVVGHCHVVIQKMQTFNDQSPPSATTFAFFKGIDDDGNGQGLLQATVTGGLPEGIYRVCTMMGTSNHQPPLMPVAQRGAQEDCTKFQIGGNTNNGNTGNANPASGNTANGNTGNVNGGNANNGNTNTGIANTGGNGAASTTARGANGQATNSVAAAAATNTATATGGRKHHSQASAAASTVANGTGNGNGNAQGATATNTANTAQMTDANNGRNRGQLLARSPYVVNPDAPLPRFIARNFIV